MDRLHREVQLRRHLRVAAGLETRRAAAAADGDQQRGSQADSLLRHRRPQGRDDHGHLRRRPRRNIPRPRRPELEAERLQPTGPRVSFAPARWRRARARRPHRGDARLGQARRTRPVRHPMRGRQRRWDNVARPRPNPLLQASRARPHLHRRPHRLPQGDWPMSRTRSRARTRLCGRAPCKRALCERGRLHAQRLPQSKGG
mmetsp:Transcript_26173/g.57353  ORF Transcript_26173/g.57353 Transcript_26173/m.57353 type:complete len:201 (+) Transcript_26173:346-948(+)